MVTEQKKTEIIKDYLDKSQWTHDICIKHGIDTKTLIEIIIETGTDFRRPKAVGKRDKKGEVKKCTKCRRITTLKDAIFCPYCGADIRSQI